MKIASAILVVWLVIGAIAGAQRHYYSESSTMTCAKGGTILVTILAGPLNYVGGVNPKIACPKPSS